jgi:high-affinity iron transporter
MRRTATAAAIASAFAAAVAVAVAPASASTSAVAHGSARRGANGEQITFGDVTCAPGWPAPQPGRDRFSVENQSSRVATVYLFRADSGVIVATLRRVRPGAVRELSATLQAGRPYAWGCDLARYPRHVSEAQRALTTRQPGGSGPVVIPVQTEQLAGPLRAYRRYVARRIARLHRQVGQLRAAIGAGGLASARRAWERAHLTWLSIGQDDGAYGAFGALGRAIDGTTAGYVGGARNPDFTGFHRVEYALWGHGGTHGARPAAAGLQRLVDKLSAMSLARAMPATRSGVDTWTLRCHEVLEDALRDTLSGEDDEGSHTALPDLAADVAVTRRLLGLLSPLLVPRSPGLVPTARRELARLDGDLVRAERTDPDRAVARWPRSSRERIDGEVGAALQTLAPVPDLLAVGAT